MDLASNSSGATEILFPAMQQVHSLFHPSPIFAQSYRWSPTTPTPALLFIGHPSVKVNSTKEGTRGKKANQRGEMRWGVMDWLAEGKEGTRQIKYARPIRNRQMRWPCCYGNTPSAAEYLGVTLLTRALQGFWTGFPPKPPDTDSFGMFFQPLRRLHISILFPAPFFFFFSPFWQ